MNILSSFLVGMRHWAEQDGVWGRRGKDGWCVVPELTKCWHNVGHRVSLALPTQSHQWQSSQTQVLCLAIVVFPCSLNDTMMAVVIEQLLIECNIRVWLARLRPWLCQLVSRRREGRWINSLQSPGHPAQTSQTINHHALESFYLQHHATLIIWSRILTLVTLFWDVTL